MDLIVRAVDWMVARTGVEDTLCSTVATPDCLPSWELLPGDIFSVLLTYFDSTADNEALRSMRCVCTTWKFFTDMRLQRLSVRMNAENSRWHISETFRNLRSLEVHVAFDSSPLESEFLENLQYCMQLEKLVLKNCKEKVVYGLKHLERCGKLLELEVDGDIFHRMQLENVTLPQLKSLGLHGCSHFTPQDFWHLGRFASLSRLLLTHVLPNWRRGSVILNELTELTDLAMVQVMATSACSAFDFLKGASRLRRLVLSVSGMTEEYFMALPAMSSLEVLSLDGCMELTTRCFRCLTEKCPSLRFLDVSCHSDVSIARDLRGPGEMSLLKELKLVNVHEIDLSSFKSALRESVRVTHIQYPDFALQNVVRTLNYDKIEAFLKSAALPGVPVCGEYFTPSILSEVAGKGRVDLLKLLMKYGADLDYGNPAFIEETLDANETCDCSTALHFAVHRGDTESVRELLHLGARVNAHCTEDSRTPLHLAASSGNLEMTKILLSANAHVNALDDSNRTPLHAAVTWRARDVITELLAQGADSHAVDLDLLAPICYAVRMADLDLLRFMVDKGMDVNEGAALEFTTPLHIAVRNGKWKGIRFLLENGADPCAKDIDGTTPLLLAARLGHCTLVESLLEATKPRGDDLNESDSNGNTLLHYAASNGWLDVVERLIQMGVDVNRTDPKGFTALYYADQQRHFKIVSRLTREGGLARWLTRPKLYRCPRIGRGHNWS